MSDLELRTLERRAKDDPEAREALAAARRRTRGSKARPRKGFRPGTPVRVLRIEATAKLPPDAFDGAWLVEETRPWTATHLGPWVSVKRKGSDEQVVLPLAALVPTRRAVRSVCFICKKFVPGAREAHLSCVAIKFAENAFQEQEPT